LAGFVAAHRDDPLRAELLGGQHAQGPMIAEPPPSTASERANATASAVRER
jgi:hypothetical protein